MERHHDGAVATPAHRTAVCSAISSISPIRSDFWRYRSGFGSSPFGARDATGGSERILSRPDQNAADDVAIDMRLEHDRAALRDHSGLDHRHSSDRQCLGAYLAGVLRIAFGTYLEAFMLSGMLLIAAAVMVLFVGGGRRVQHREVAVTSLRRKQKRRSGIFHVVPPNPSSRAESWLDN